MTLENCEKNRNLVVISLDMLDEKFKMRLYEIGFFPGSKIRVLKLSPFKRTILVNVLDSCFAVKFSLAKSIEVEYE